MRVKVDGKEFDHVSGSVEGGIMSLRGPRGGAHTLVRNIKHGYWVLIGSGIKPRETHVRVVEVMA